MNIGVSTASLYPLYTEQALYEIAVRGIEYAELFLNATCETHPEYMCKIVDIIKEYGINVVSFHPFSSPMESVYLFSNYSRRIDEMMELYKTYFNAMNEMGATIFVLHGASNINKRENAEYFERYLQLYRLGKQFGITVAQENVYYCKSGNLDFLKQMSSELKDEVQFVIDIKQAIRSNLTVYDIIDAVGDKTVHYHVSDSDDKRDCLPVGEGSFDFYSFINKLVKQGFNGSLVIELYRENYNEYDELADSVKALKTIVAEVAEVAKIPNNH